LRFDEVAIWGDRENEVPKTGGELNIRLHFTGEVVKPRPSRLSISISTMFGAPLIVCSTEMTEPQIPMIAAGDTQICHIPILPLTVGSYLLTLFVEQAGVIQDWLPSACQFDVHDADFYGFGRNIPIGWEGRTVLVSHVWRSSVDQST
jgi:Wzt C-terminal domain